MDADDRAELRAAHIDNTAIGTVAISGVVAVCGELLAAGVFSQKALSRISEFMLAAVERSGATEQLQAHLHQALSRQFSSLADGALGRDT